MSSLRRCIASQAASTYQFTSARRMEVFRARRVVVSGNKSDYGRLRSGAAGCNCLIEPFADFVCAATDAVCVCVCAKRDLFTVIVVSLVR